MESLCRRRREGGLWLLLSLDIWSVGRFRVGLNDAVIWICAEQDPNDAIIGRLPFDKFGTLGSSVWR